MYCMRGIGVSVIENQENLAAVILRYYVRSPLDVGISIGRKNGQSDIRL